MTDYNYVEQSTAVLYGAPTGVSLTAITNANGAANTAMVSHVGCNPRDYPDGPTAWYDCLQPFDTRSMPDGQVPPGQMDQAFSSPHPGVNGVLFADGHVQMIPHDWLSANPSVWNWMNTTPLQMP